MDEIRIGIFGVGHRGIHWLRILDRMDGYRITAIGDMFPQLHERALGELSDSNGVATHSSYEEMLADSNVDAIALCVRCEEQGAMAAMALEAGKHVNSEVPASHTMEDCWRIVAARSGRGSSTCWGNSCGTAGSSRHGATWSSPASWGTSDTSRAST